MFFSDVSAEALARHVLRGEAITFPTTNWQVALHTADPGTNGTPANEVSTADWSNYARQNLTRNTTDWSAGSLVSGQGYRVANNVAANFGTVTLINPTTLTHATLINDADTNVWFIGAFPSPIALINGQPFSIPVDFFGITWISQGS